MIFDSDMHEKCTRLFITHTLSTNCLWTEASMQSLLKQFSIKAKILAVVLLLMLLMLISSGYALRSMASVDEELISRMALYN